jgi:NADH dehydrogenase [ubiquinone] 1 alpha subcomplex assembly factor 1
MRRYLCCLIFFVTFVVSSLADAQAKDSGRILFDFSQPNAAARWQIVNDGVMGGKSTSRAEVLADSQMRFAGRLSLENNGGFASVRSKPDAAEPTSLGLREGDVIVMLVRGDGRKYTFNLYLPDGRTAFSHQLEFQTQANQWTEIQLPIDRFVAHSFGRPVRGATLDPARVHAIGILLGDKQAGTFEIIVDWIKVIPAAK